MNTTRRRVSLRGKILLVMLVVTGTALLLSGIVSVLLARRSVNEATRDELAKQADVLVDFLAEPSIAVPQQQGDRRAGLGLFTALLRLVGQVESAEIYRVGLDGVLRQPERIDVEADLLADFDPSVLDVESLLRGERQSGRLRGPDGTVVWVAAGLQGRTGGYVFVLSASPETDRTLWRSPLALAGISALAFALAMSVWFSNRLTRPIRRLQTAAGAIAAGDLSARVEPEGSDEVGDLAESFNRMADELERSRRAERSFVMSVSHDLRTPLTSIKGYGEAIADGAVTGDAAVHAGKVIEYEAGRLERLVHDLLDLARLDAREFRLHEQVVDLGVDLVELSESFGQRVKAAGLSFRVSAASLPVTRTDPDRVVQVVANLLENALRYTPEGGTIEVRWAACPPSEGLPGGSVRVDVSDTGRGMPPDVVEHVFERLYVAEHLPGERPAGTGLGLAIVSELTRALGGTVSVRSEVGRGSIFSVWIPIRA